MQANEILGRIPVQIVEIEQDLCALTYGVGACTAMGAGNSKCYNTFASCQVIEAYTLGDPLILRFSKSQTDFEIEEYSIPSLQTVSTNATEINVGSRSGTSKPLGKRAKVTITFKDHAHSDVLVDPYLSERSYNPYDHGTFWGKWLKRNPYYTGRMLRVYDGYAGQTLAQMKSRSYVIESMTLPDSRGNVTCIAADILRLADDDRAQCPRITTGKLVADIDETATTFQIVGGTLVDYSQNATNAVRIGDEVITYTGKSESLGIITFTGCVRGAYQTTPEAHEADDAVQACVEYSLERPDAIAYDLLTEFGNVDAQYINLTDWTEEGDAWFGSVFGSRLLTKPIGVTTLLGELCEQYMFFIWWDDEAQLIRLKAIAPISGAVPLLTPEKNLLQNSVVLKTDESQRISEVWASFFLKSPVEDTDKIDSYRRTILSIDQTASSEFEYGQRRTYEVFSAWIVNDVQISLLSARLLARYRNNPIIMSFKLDAKDRGLVDVASVFDVAHSGFVDFNGNQVTQRYQVTSINESVAGDTIDIKAIKFDYDIDFRLGFWTPSDYPIYELADETQKNNGAWWADEEGNLGTDSGYLWS